MNFAFVQLSRVQFEGLIDNYYCDQEINPRSSRLLIIFPESLCLSFNCRIQIQSINHKKNVNLHPELIFKESSVFLFYFLFVLLFVFANINIQNPCRQSPFSHSFAFFVFKYLFSIIYTRFFLGLRCFDENKLPPTYILFSLNHFHRWLLNGIHWNFKSSRKLIIKKNLFKWRAKNFANDKMDRNSLPWESDWKTCPRRSTSNSNQFFFLWEKNFHQLCFNQYENARSDVKNKISYSHWITIQNFYRIFSAFFSGRSKKGNAELYFHCARN
jgi:hypothetical protein